MNLSQLSVHTRFINRLWLAWCKFFWLGLWLFGLSLLLLYPIRWLYGDHFAIVRLANYVLPWLLLPLLPAIAIAGIARRRRLLVMLAIPMLLISLPFAHLFLPRSRAIAKSDDFSIKIMSHNVFGNQDVEAVADAIRQEQPDVVLLQEFNAVISPTLVNELSDVYHEGELYLDVANSQAILSRYPIKRTSIEWDKGRVQKMILKTPVGPIAIWNVHFYPPFMYPIEQHDRQTVALVQDIAAVNSPLIVAGDFNVTDQSAGYRLINKYLHNAHWDVGWGLGFSFPALPYTKGLPIAPGPALRLDHIFYNNHFIARRAETLHTSGGSDHLPIIAELSLVR